MPLDPKQQPPYYTPGSNTNVKIYKGTANSPAGAGLIPNFTIYQNTVGTIVWTAISPGYYMGTLEGAFPDGKVWAIPGGNAQQIGMGIGYSLPFDHVYNIQRTSDNTIHLSIQKTSDYSYVDLYDIGTAGAGQGLPFEINIYQ